MINSSLAIQVRKKARIAKKSKGIHSLMHRVSKFSSKIIYGALAGPVVAAAVILNPERPLPEGLDDSKKLTARERERIAEELLQTALAFAVGQVESEEIDRINILQASPRAMLDALRQLDPCADYLLIDAAQLKEAGLPQKAIIHSDSISASIAAASVVAKTYRDALMRSFHEVYPQYNFAKHVGYSAREHLEALRVHGPCQIHRKSFHGVVTCKDE